MMKMNGKQIDCKPARDRRVRDAMDHIGLGPILRGCFHFGFSNYPCPQEAWLETTGWVQAWIPNRGPKAPVPRGFLLLQGLEPGFPFEEITTPPRVYESILRGQPGRRAEAEAGSQRTPRVPIASKATAGEFLTFEGNER